MNDPRTEAEHELARSVLAQARIAQGAQEQALELLEDLPLTMSFEPLVRLQEIQAETRALLERLESELEARRALAEADSELDTDPGGE